MVTAAFVLYGQFKDAHRHLELRAGGAGDPVPVPMMFSSAPGDFALVSIFAGSAIVLKFANKDMPESFMGDFPDALEVHALTVR